MKRFAVFCLTIGLLVSTMGQAKAGSITTTFASNNGAAGNMFDITTFGNALTVNTMAFNLEPSNNNPHSINVYTRMGSYIGFENNAAGWTLVSQTTGTISAGQDTPTLVDVMDFSLLANSVTGIYVTTVGSSTMDYTNGSDTFENADLRLDLGVGKGEGLFTGGTFNPRTWNGTINYTIDNGGPVGAVPEPGTILLMGTGLMGLVGWKYRKGTKA